MKMKILFLALSTILCVTAQDDDCNADWSNGPAHTCVLYAGQGWCTSDGEYGAGWSESWGTFEDYARVDDGTTGWVCPQCGCGQGTETTTAKPTPKPTEEVTESGVEAACCTSWSAECYTTASSDNNNHACKDCGYAVEHCDNVCSSLPDKSGDLADSDACKECCQGYDHEISWNCPASDDGCNPDWNNDGAHTCTTYAENEWCTSDGEYGAGWQEYFGTIEGFANAAGESAWVCPECGCGQDAETTTAKPTPKPTEEVTESGASGYTLEIGICQDANGDLLHSDKTQYVMIANDDVEGLNTQYCLDLCDASPLCTAVTVPAADYTTYSDAITWCELWAHTDYPTTGNGHSDFHCLVKNGPIGECDEGTRKLDLAFECVSYCGENTYEIVDEEDGTILCEYSAVGCCFSTEASCYQLNMYDSWGDGWGNNQLLIEGVAYSIDSGDYGSESFCLSDATTTIHPTPKPTESGAVTTEAEATTAGPSCIHVNHVNDFPGTYTCDCVSESDPCLSDKTCVPTDMCPSMQNEMTADCRNIDNEVDCVANDICTAKIKKNGSFKKCKYKTCKELASPEFEEACALHYNCRTKYRKNGEYKTCKKIGAY